MTASALGGESPSLIALGYRFEHTTTASKSARRYNRSLEDRTLRSMATVLLIGALCGEPLYAQQPLLLGVLEDVPGTFAGETNSRRVRVAFRKVGDGWEAFESNCPDEACLKAAPARFPPEVKWTIAFDGRNLGVVSARTPPVFDLYSHIGLQTISSARRVPTVGRRSRDFGGFLDDPVFRPLVAVSVANVMDPDQWKRTHLSSMAIASLRHAFRTKFPMVTNCRNDTENIARRWTYSDANIALGSAYVSKSGSIVVPVWLKSYRCDGPPDSPFLEQWYVMDRTQHIDALGESMWLVDAADYDNDGHSEVLFAISGYNRGGYVLFYDNFSRRATFEFTYH